MAALFENSFEELVAEAVAKEREEIAKLLESMTTEWRPSPASTPHVSVKGWSKSGKPEAAGGGGYVEYPSSVPNKDEVRILTEAARRVRSRK